MLKLLVRNTIISGAAYFVSGFLALLVVPVIIHAYGLQLFGLIVIARNFLPTGVLALVDFGVSETATQAVAKARAGYDWNEVGGQIRALLFGMLSVGVISGVALWVLTSYLSWLFDAPSTAQAGFVFLLKTTALMLPLFFAGLLLEGVAKGFENYAILRILEVASTLAYVAITFWLISSQLDYYLVGVAFLACIAMKYLVLIVATYWACRKTSLRLVPWSQRGLTEVIARSRTMLHNRVLGVIQGPSIPLVIGALVGAHAVGVYDVIARLPRFFKSIFSLLTTALLPVAAKLEQKSDKTRLANYGHAGVIFPSLLAIAPLSGLAILSQEILEIWVGRNMGQYWPWVSAMFLIPILNVMLSSGQTMMLTRREFVAKGNNILTIQALLQMGISVLFVSLIQERSFVMGQVLMAVIFFPIYVSILFKEFTLKQITFYLLLAKQVLVVFGLLPLLLVVKHYGLVTGWPQLLTALAVWCVIYWLIAYRFLLSHNDRTGLRKIVYAAVGTKN